MRKSVGIVLSALLLALPFGGLSACKKRAESGCRYRLEGEYFEEDRRLDAVAEITVPNRTDRTLQEIPFALWGNAYRPGAKLAPASVHGEDCGGVEIKAVAGATWRTGGQDDTILYVSLSAPIYPDESATVTVEYSLTLAKTAHRLGVGENCVNLSWFYPALCVADQNGFCEYEEAGFGEAFVTECADFDVLLTVPEKYTAAYGGEGSEVAKDGKKTYHVVAQNVRDAAFVFGEFSCVKTERDGVSVEYYYTADEAPEKTLAAAAEGIVVFSDLFGKYAYPRYTVVETDFPLGGMEYSAFVMISSSLRREERDAVVLHETAHQWWYASVGSNQYQNAWQDEGLAEYSVALFYERRPSYGDYRTVINNSERAYRAYFSVASQLSKEVNTAMTRPLSSYSSEYEYRILSYDKGVVLFDRLREIIGKRRFFAALEKYAERYGGKLASAEDMISCFGQEELFASFLDGKCVI